MSESYLNAFKTIRCEEDSANDFSLASAKRKSLFLKYFASLQVADNSQTAEFLVEEDLENYAEIVDNKNSAKVNNYADYVLTILSNFQNDDRLRWNSHLTSFNTQNNLEPFPCSNDLNCKNPSAPLNSSRILKQAFLRYKEGNEAEESEISKINSVCNNRPLKRSISFEKSAVDKNVQPEEDHENHHKLKETVHFRTARDELHIQNARKFGKNSNQNERPNLGPIKKTLGARKGGVFGKFQPPIRSNENESKENNIKREPEKLEDERFKNIDPAMIELIKNEIMYSGSKITWDDIAGLNLAKNTIQEIVVWPMLRPDIFTGLRRPPKGILLFGPPGTGKTLIGKCIASQSNSTFFSISASSLTSKWVGDGEKMVRTLFAVAKVYQPSVVFIDEIDSLLTQRSDSDHECSRRIKTEFLVQLDGAGTGDEDRILIIGATNRPQELDEAARRRLVKRLYIPLPDAEARKQIIENLISTERHSLTEPEIEHVAKMTKGYSGADVKNLCQEASLGPIRSIPPNMIQNINPEDVRPVNLNDFESALCRIKSSVSESDLDIYLSWDKQYGCGSGSG